MTSQRVENNSHMITQVSQDKRVRQTIKARRNMRRLTAKAALAADIAVDAPRPELMRKKRALSGNVESSPHSSQAPA